MKVKHENERVTHVITYNEALKGHKDKQKILAILKIGDPDSPVKMPTSSCDEAHNKKTTRNVDTYEYIQRSLMGLYLFWWNYDE